MSNTANPMQRVVVFGASAGMVEETIRMLARDHAALVLVGRHEGRVEAIAADARVRGASGVTTIVRDLNDTGAHERLWHDACAALGGEVDGVVVAWGVLGDADAARVRHDEAMRILHANFTAPASLLVHIAGTLERQRRGALVVIGSVAGDRGRQSNYTYGAAKGGLALFVDGLRNRLHRSGVRVVTVKPGFVDTPMTAHIARKGPLFVSADVAGRAIHALLLRGNGVAYVPGFWRGIMAIIRAIPEPIFQKLSL